MSSYEGNPVGCLYEKYQSSGVSPLYEVTMKKGQAHAPIFEAVLTVPEGFKVSAQANNKKTAKNLAAKLMLDKLAARHIMEEEEEREDNANIKEVTDNVSSVKQDDANNNLKQVEDSSQDDVMMNTSSLSSPELPTLASQPTAAASVATFYHRLQKSQGPVLDNLHNGNICLVGDVSQDDYVPVLEMLAQEQQFKVSFIQLEALDNVQQSLVQIISEDQTHPITVCLGMGPYSKNIAARCALMYIKLMSRPDSEQ